MFKDRQSYLRKSFKRKINGHYQYEVIAIGSIPRAVKPEALSHCSTQEKRKKKANNPGFGFVNLMPLKEAQSSHPRLLLGGNRSPCLWPGSRHYIWRPTRGTDERVQKCCCSPSAPTFESARENEQVLE